MRDAAGSDAECAGIAVHRVHGGRGGPVTGSREKSAHGRQERLHSVLRHGAHAQRRDARTGGAGSIRAGRFHSKNGEAGT